MHLFVPVIGKPVDRGSMKVGGTPERLLGPCCNAVGSPEAQSKDGVCILGYLVGR